MTYPEWLLGQTEDRQKASLHLMELSSELGKTNPFSPRAKELRIAIRQHYETHDD